MGVIQKYLGDIFNLFPLGGSTGGVVVRKKGGTAGTDEMKLSVGTNGALALQAANTQTTNLLTVTDNVARLVYNSGTEFSIRDNCNLSHGGGTAALSINTSTGGGFFNTHMTISGGGGAGSRPTLLTSGGAVFTVYRDWDGTGTGWMQNSAGRSRVTTADVTNTSTTFAAITGLTATLIAGRKYSGWLALKVNSATAADGIKFDFNGGTATMTNFWASVYPIAGAPATKGVDLSTALNTALTFTAMGDTNDAVVLFSINLVCNAAGTFIPEFALNGGSGTATVRVSSAMWLDDIP